MQHKKTESPYATPTFKLKYRPPVRRRTYVYPLVALFLPFVLITAVLLLDMTTSWVPRGTGYIAILVCDLLGAVVVCIACYRFGVSWFATILVLLGYCCVYSVMLFRYMVLFEQEVRGNVFWT